MSNGPRTVNSKYQLSKCFKIPFKKLLLLIFFYTKIEIFLCFLFGLKIYGGESGTKSSESLNNQILLIIQTFQKK